MIGWRPAISVISRLVKSTSPARSKDLIIRAGRNLYPDEIEHAIGDLDHVRKGRIAVFAVDDPKAATERLIVLAETRLEDADTKARLRHQIVEVVTALTDLPPDDVLLVGPGTVLKTANGKIRRSACRSLYESGANRTPSPCPRPAVSRTDASERRPRAQAPATDDQDGALRHLCQFAGCGLRADRLARGGCLARNIEQPTISSGCCATLPAISWTLPKCSRS